MTEQALMRYFFAIILVAGLIVLCIAIADKIWLVGLVLIVVGLVVGGPLWWWHFDKEAEAREADRLRPMKVPDEEPQV
jgi:hypothetical protein